VLTAELAGVRRRGGDLRLVATDANRRARIEALAAELGAVARAHIGRPRGELDEAFAAAASAAAHVANVDRRLAGAVTKLVRDGCRFDEPDPEASIALRREVFRRAAAARRAATPLAPFDRAAVVSADEEARLYADRPAAQRLLAVELPGPRALATGFPLAEAQAVLLRATKVRATVRARDAATLRALFRTLKFLRLLPVITAGPDGTHHIELDGPLSLFQGGTRYGLQLGLALPAIASCESWSIDADVAWGADRQPLRFRLAGVAADAGVVPPPFPDQIAALVAAFEKLESGWRIDRDPAVLDLPGAGLCVPDLAFVRERDGARVFFELLGFWSREAVWRRVELVRAGLPHRILFAASRALRVSESVLDDSAIAALYVFARTLNAKQVLTHIERLT
jgi:predicted nuclease of restriction endonuclease-like RecB superfamily